MNLVYLCKILCPKYKQRSLMKKWLIGLAILFLVFMACVYLFIPDVISLKSNLTIPANPQSFYRTVPEDKKWEKWWPGEKTSINKSDGNFFSFNGFNYFITDKKFNSIVFSIKDKTLATEAFLNFIPIRGDSVLLSWEGNIKSSKNPLKRPNVYFKSKQLHKDLDLILDRMRLFYSNDDNIYGLHIEKSFVVDSNLVSTNTVSKGYPTTEIIYSMVDQLKKYILSQSAKETGYPMLNISTQDSLNFLTRVAIPTDKKLKSSGSISYRWMLGGGNILIAEVKGGPSSIQNAFEQIDHYIADYHRVAPAIPFQSLVTDRRQERDTARWVTKIYYPVK